MTAPNTDDGAEDTEDHTPASLLSNPWTRLLIGALSLPAAVILFFENQMAAAGGVIFFGGSQLLVGLSRKREASQPPNHD